MKFVDFKKSLAEIAPCYVFYGTDAFLVENALKNLMTVCGEEFPELNRSFFIKQEADKFLAAVQTLPFCASKKLVVVRDFEGNEGDIDKINGYLKVPNTDAVLAIVAVNDNSMKLNATFVDCSPLDDDVLRKKILYELKLRNLTIDEVALSSLMQYCSNMLGKIMQEISKFETMRLENGRITQSVISANVSKDENYGIFELTEKLARKDCDGALKVLSFYIEKDGGKGVLALIYNNFRRMLHSILSQDSDAEVASLLAVKPYAITLARKQARLFGARALNKICAFLTDIDFKIKNGNMSSENALYYIVFKICGEDL